MPQGTDPAVEETQLKLFRKWLRSAAPSRAGLAAAADDFLEIAPLWVEVAADAAGRAERVFRAAADKGWKAWAAAASGGAGG